MAQFTCERQDSYLPHAQFDAETASKLGFREGSGWNHADPASPAQKAAASGHGPVMPEGIPPTAMAVQPQPLPLPALLPAGACGFAVLDLETTGTGQLCRAK